MKIKPIIWNPNGKFREQNEYHKIIQCPRCKINTLPIGYSGALSRADNETEVCSGCGQQEAFIDYAMKMNMGKNYKT